MMDEVCPPPRQTADDWIAVRLLTGVELSGPNEDEGDKTGRRRVMPGTVVSFRAYFDLGKIEIAVQPDGSWRPSDPLVIDGSIGKATLFCEEDDGDTTTHSLDEIARHFVTNYGPLTDSHIVPVLAWHWTKPIPFALTRRDDQSYTFRQLADEVQA